jgi:hypothetical protein
MGKFHFKRLLWMAGALAHCLTYCSVTWAQPASPPKACERQDASALRACARTCFPVCRDGNIATRGSAVWQVCNELALQRTREDQPSCQALITTAPDSAGIGIKQSSLDDRCSAFANPTVDDGIPETGKPPPACLRSFPHLRCRFDRLAEDAGDLARRFTPMVNRYRPLLDLVRPKQEPEETEKLLCGVSLQDMSNDFRTSEALGAEVKAISEEFDSQSRCISEIQEWIKDYKCVSTLDCGNIGDSIIRGFVRRIEPAMIKRGDVERLLANVKQSRNVILDMRSLHRAVCDIRR